MERYKRFFLGSILGLILACAYPLYMTAKVIAGMVRNGAIPYERYPKYIIPYSPIAIALIFGVLIMPLLQKFFRKANLLIGSVMSLGVFLLIERIMETKILVLATRAVALESWQMSLCYVPPDMFKTRKWEAVDILLGGYNPAFKLHFYLISVVLIIALLNCFYGFGKMILRDDYRRLRALTVQAVTALVFLGMCIWACFTAFYRTGELIVSPLSAVLMAIFFALLGITVGVFAGSCTLGKKKTLGIFMPSVTASLVTLIMYVGEMILLNGNLYRFGKGFFFDEIPELILAPVDLVVIVAAGLLTGLICSLLRKGTMK